jgi:hypothetical protein
VVEDHSYLFRCVRIGLFSLLAVFLQIKITEGIGFNITAPNTVLEKVLNTPTVVLEGTV